MPVETPSFFAQAIQEHLELKRRNAPLEPEMPISEYMAQDPFENHPLFKTEEQARVEDTFIVEPNGRDGAAADIDLHAAEVGEAPLGLLDPAAEPAAELEPEPDA